MLTSVVQAIHNSAREQRDAGSRFRRPIASSTPAPRNVLPPPWPDFRGGFLIANLRLKIFAFPTKQTIGAKSNRERIAFFVYDSSRDLSTIQFRPEISNRNIRIIKNSPKPCRNNTYVFSNRNKTAHSGILQGLLPDAGGLPIRPASSQETVRQPHKSVRIREEMAVSPQALGTRSTTAQDFIDSVNPATGEVVARIPARSEE